MLETVPTRAKIPAPANQTNPYVACKELQAVALPILYHTFELSLVGLPDISKANRWTVVIDTANTGLSFVSHVKVAATGGGLWIREPENMSRLLLRTLPRDTLCVCCKSEADL